MSEGAGEARTGAPRLPAGRHGLPREFVVQNQRERIVTALVDTVAEHGYHATSVAKITKAASVSRRTFYEHFADKEACFLGAYEMIDEHLRAAVRDAAEAADGWPQRVRAGLEALLGSLAAEPELAAIFMVEPLAAGGEVARRHREAIEGILAILWAGRPRQRGAARPPTTIEEALAGGTAALIVREIVAGRGGDLEALLPDLVALTLTPYVGVDEAARLARA